jgi:hypothetical protein
MRRLLERVSILVCDLDKRCGHLIFKAVTGYIVNYPLAVKRSYEQAQTLERTLAQHTIETAIMNELVKENAKLRVRLEEVSSGEEEAKKWAQVWQERYMQLESHLRVRELEAANRANELQRLHELRDTCEHKETVPLEHPPMSN